MAQGTVIKTTGRGGKTVWRARLDAGTDPGTGKRRQIMQSFATRREADAWLAQQHTAQATGGFVTPSRLTLGAYLDTWLVGRDDVRETTKITYASLIKVQIKPALGATTLQSLRQPAITAFLATQRTAGKSRATVGVLRAILGRALEDARREGLLPTNPARGVRVTGQQERTADDATLKYWTADQARTFLTFTRNHKDAALFRLALASGMRVGEMLALTWGNVDLAQGTLTVRRTLTHVQGGFTSGPPKTRAGLRAIPLDANTIATLKRHRITILELQALHADVWVANDLVFPHADGAYRDPQTMRRSLKTLCPAAGVPELSPHGLQHSAATLLLSAGVPAKVVSERLGHSSITITLDTYSHVTPALQREAATALGAALG
jgi:integrase